LNDTLSPDRARADASAQPPTAGRRLAFVGATVMLCLAVVAAGAELMARLKGFEPWTPSRDPELRVEPRSLGVRHPVLGSVYAPGRFVVTLADGYSFRVTHDGDGHRITRPLAAGSDRAGKVPFWIFGCSYTHGWSLDDEDTYPWLVQEQLPGYDVVNFGVGGYGTVHSLLQFREALASRPAPRVAVIAYGSFHDARNTLNRYRTKGITVTDESASVPLPCARLGPDGALEIFTVQADHYRPWPLQGSLAFVNMLEEQANRRELQRLRGGRVSQAIVAEFARLAALHGTTVVVAGIQRNPETREMLQYARRIGIESTDISVRDAPEFQNLPHDAHPNALANRRFAEKLVSFLRDRGLDRPADAPRP
jgi:hypothetical protein